MAEQDTLEEILSRAKLSADQRKLFDNTLNENPDLKKGWLRQSDYSRNMNELSARKKEYDDAVALKGQVQSWWEEKKPIWEGLIEAGAIDEDSQPLWPKERTRLQQELEDAKKAAVAGADMDPAELDKRVKDIVKAAGGATTEEIKALVASEAARMAKETFHSEYETVKKEFNEKTIPFTTGFATSMSIAAAKYEKETGEEWTDETQKAVFELMAKEGDFNPRSAVTKFMAPAVAKKQTEAEIKRRVAEELDNERKRMGYDPDQPFIPQNLGEPGAKGSLQKMLEASAEAEGGDPETLVMAASRKAAAELRAAGRM